MAQEPSESSREIAERAASALRLESGLFENLDAAGVGEALAGALRSSLRFRGEADIDATLIGRAFGGSTAGARAGKLDPHKSLWTFGGPLVGSA